MDESRRSAEPPVATEPRVIEHDTAAEYFQLCDSVSRLASEYRQKLANGRCPESYATRYRVTKLAALHRIPAFMSSVPPGGDFAPSILEALGQKPRPRTFTTAFGDDELVADLKTSGRRTLILSGVVSEMVVQQTALDALGAGYEVLVAVDACGGISNRTEDAAWRRIAGAGGSFTSVATFGGELAGDLTSDIGTQTFGLVAETFVK